ncbi:MAG: GNAT family N-acyltransferase, partial [Flavobacteriia bacterium]
MNNLSNIKFREAQNKTELEALFTLRYQVYQEDRNLQSMLSENNLDLTVYDLNALHFGAFENDKAIAYIRLVAEKETHFTFWVKEIISELGIQLEKQKFPFPFQNYYPDLSWSEDFIESLENRIIGEVGRLAIHKDYRQAGEILDALFENFITYCKNQGINTA